MDLNLVTRGGEGRTTRRRDGARRHGGEDERGRPRRIRRRRTAGRARDKTVDETVAESATTREEDEVEVGSTPRRGRRRERRPSHRPFHRAATFSAASRRYSRRRLLPRTPPTPTVTPTASPRRRSSSRRPHPRRRPPRPPRPYDRSWSTPGRRTPPECQRLRLEPVRVRRLVCKRLFVGANEGGIERRAEEGVHRPGARVFAVGSDAAEAFDGDGSRRREGEPTPGRRRDNR